MQKNKSKYQRNNNTQFVNRHNLRSFAKLQSSVVAQPRSCLLYTSTDSGKTVYYFKTAENFIENFRVLLDFVETPYFEKTSVENEKSIIKNEIAMYDDEPEWKTFFTALKNLWPESPMVQERCV